MSKIFHSYDFFGLTERLEESLVVLMMLLDLDINDILYLSSKQDRHFLTGDGNGNLRCVELHPKIMTDTIKAHYASDEWNELNEQDIILYQAANSSLDLTIESLGRGKFLMNLAKYRDALNVAKAKCSSRIVALCEYAGPPREETNCYARDEGCGHECLDEIGKLLVDDDILASGSDRVRIAWLQSFPNSGTSFTLSAIATLTGTDLATNFGTETKGELTPVFPELESGPYWLPRHRGRQQDGYVLTKTHCGGRCTTCPPQKFVQSQEVFLLECLRYCRLSDKGDLNLVYPLSIVEKTVHLIRDPFDNIVSRFHHQWNSRSFTDEMRENYPKNAVGFRAFCRDFVDVWPDLETFIPTINGETLSKFLIIPCHTDFLRYAFWHNHVGTLNDIYEIPTLVVHYEDYDTLEIPTYKKILDFLERPRKGDATFIKGKTYRQFFSDN